MTAETPGDGWTPIGYLDETSEPFLTTEQQRIYGMIQKYPTAPLTVQFRRSDAYPVAGLQYLLAALEAMPNKILEDS